MAAPETSAATGASDDDDPPLRIEDYALIGDCLTGALVGRNGSIDWLCWPRFDSDACFAALLGTSRHGRWLIAPAAPSTDVRRTYRGDTMILETCFASTEGSVAVVDFMPTGQGNSSVVRRIEGRRGRVAMRMHLVLRFDYGSSTPWVTRLEEGCGICATVGPNLVVLRTSAALQGRGKDTVAEFTVGEGESVDFVMTWGPAHLPAPDALDVGPALERTEAFWRDWSARCEYQGEWRAPVMRSLLTLKALTYEPTGAIIAALTTSLPEQLGGARNWDYRYCWLRDATLTLVALMAGGYDQEAKAWSRWLHRAVAGVPSEAQIMYGISGERRLLKWSPSWLPGYQGAAPVRIGNAAAGQLQLDVFGEVIGVRHLAREKRLDDPAFGWETQTLVVEHLESIWNQPDDGIWEMRGDRKHFTHSKVMAWVAVDRSIGDAETFGLEAPLDRWRALRDRMHAQICEKGFDQTRNTFIQSFGDPALDASLLLLAVPEIGFLPPDDPRMRGTVAAIEQELLVDGLLLRYRTDAGDDALPPGEGAFLPCSFWLAGVYALQGRHADARALFERLLALANDVGLLAEEYDPRAARQVGNFPQAFSHLALIAAALNLRDLGSPETGSH